MARTVERAPSKSSGITQGMGEGDPGCGQVSIYLAQEVACAPVRDVKERGMNEAGNRA